jgi:hypothetical protein
LDAEARAEDLCLPVSLGIRFHRSLDDQLCPSFTLTRRKATARIRNGLSEHMRSTRRKMHLRDISININVTAIPDDGFG